MVLMKDYNGHTKGTHLHCVKVIDASGDYLRYNARCVYFDEPAEDEFFHRTFPGEYLRRLPFPGEEFTVNWNQGDRPARVLAVLGHEMLYDYEMPAGKVFMRICYIGCESDGRSVSEESLPKKWRKAMEEQ